MYKGSLRDKLKDKSKDELKVITKRLKISGYSGFNKLELVDSILKSDVRGLEREIFPSWWRRYHNHVYGSVTVLALLLSVAFYYFPFKVDEDPYMEGARRVVNVLESPLGFRDYSSMNQLKRQEIFILHRGQRVTWEGYVVSFVGFVPGALGKFPFESEIGIEMVPLKRQNWGLKADFMFDPVLPTDSGYELMSQLYLLSEGQRVRMNGLLGGTPENPVLSDSWIDGVYPLNE